MHHYENSRVHCSSGTLLRCLAVMLTALMFSGCGPKKPAKTNGAPSKADKSATTKSTTKQAASNLGPASTKAASPAKAVKPAASATVTTAPPPREDSIALFFADKGSNDFALPTVAKPTTVRATAINAAGSPILDLQPVAGSRLLLIAARPDLSWVKVVPPPTLNGADAATHTFELTFPKAGPHILLFVFHPEGASRVVVPSYVKVGGERKPDTPPGGAQASWKGAGGLLAKLLVPPLIDVCTPVSLASAWTRRGKPVQLEGLRVVARPDKAKGKKLGETASADKASAKTKGAVTTAAPVTYIALQPGAKKVQIFGPDTAKSIPEPPKTASKWPKTTMAQFTPQMPGSIALLAVTRVKGQPVVARFDMVVGGKLPKGGCK